MCDQITTPGTPNEAVITINGHTLTATEAMTVRVALGAFVLSLQGDLKDDDEQGRALADGYLSAVQSIFGLMRAARPT